MTAVEPEATVSITESQLDFFDWFGFLVLPGYLDPVLDSLDGAFDEVMRDPGPTFRDGRELLPRAVGYSDALVDFLESSFVEKPVAELCGGDFNYLTSDANLFRVGSGWHNDGYLPVRHVKLLVYLDPLTACDGALRVIPGSNRWDWPTTVDARAASFFDTLDENVPHTVLETRPGDLVLMDYRTWHAALGRTTGRRMLALSFSERYPEAELPVLERWIADYDRFGLDTMFGPKVLESDGPRIQQVLANEGELRRRFEASPLRRAG